MIHVAFLLILRSMQYLMTHGDFGQDLCLKTAWHMLIFLLPFDKKIGIFTLWQSN